MGGDFGTQKTTLPLASSFDAWSLLEKAKREQEAIGFYLFAHPLATYQETLDRLGVVPSTDIEKKGKHATALMLAGVPTTVKTRLSKKGKRFAFVTFSDAFGSFEAVLFEETLHESRALLETNEPLLVSVGIKYDEDGSYRLMANRIRSLKERVDAIPKKVRITLDEGASALDTALSLLKHQRGGNDTVAFSLKGESMIQVDLDGAFKVDPQIIETLGTLSGLKVSVEE